MIPKTLFQTWKSKDDIPDDFLYWSSTLAGANPGYKHVLWDDADNRDFIDKNYNWFLPIYDAYPAEIYRADAVRYFFLYHFGGIYADMDVEGLKSLDDLLDRADIILARMGTDAEFEHSLPNAFMASMPGQEFWLCVIANMMERAHEEKRPEYLTGPVLLKESYDEYRAGDVAAKIHKVKSLIGPVHPNIRSEIEVLPGHLVYPLNWADKLHDVLRRTVLKTGQLLSPEAARNFFPKAYVVTYWRHSWEPQQL